MELLNSMLAEPPLVRRAVRFRRHVPSPQKKQTSVLLSDRFYGITNFEARSRNRGAHRGDIVHVTQPNHADRRAHAADYFPGNRVFDFAGNALDVELISDFQSRLPSDVQNNLSSV